jgi:soluble lytic murein transglycosylase-like protein
MFLGLLLAVAETESDFDPDCRTGACVGLMQINSRYVTEYAALAGMEDWDLYDPEDSMRIAASMLYDYMTRYEGDLHFALMAYNLGEWGARSKRADGVQTTNYSRKVVGRIERYAEVERAAQKVEEAETDKVDEVDALTAVAAGIHELIREVLFK